MAQNTPIHYYVPRKVTFIAGIPQDGRGNIYTNINVPGQGKSPTVYPGTLTGKSKPRTR